ncbi:MAG: hypothetical protein ACREDK_08860 [Thermoplasmata archaeon]
MLVERLAELTVNLRLSLTVFKVGFLAESIGGFVALFGNHRELPFHGYLIALTPVFSALGILFLWAGRHEWNALHRSRVGHANLAFATTFVATALAAAPIAYLSLTGGPNPPPWIALEFAVAVALVVGVTFVTYALVAAHLVGPTGEVAMALGLLWAIIISAEIGLALSHHLSTIVTTIAGRSLSIEPIAQPITLLDALLGFSYLAFFVAFVDAHWRVAKGLDLPVAGPAAG